MEDLPDSLISEISQRIEKTADRNAFSMVSTRLCSIEAHQRDFLRVGCGLHPAAEVLTSLCIRFLNLTRLEIVYSGWMSSMGKQLDNSGLTMLSRYCPKLVELTLSFCAFIDDMGLSHLAHCESLRVLKLNFVPGISSNGLLSVVAGCKSLSALCLSRCMKVSSVEWLEYVGKHGNLEVLSVKNCRGLGQDDLVMLGRGWKKLKRLEFELDMGYRHWRVYEMRKVREWANQELRCNRLRELSLVHCCLDAERPLSYVLRGCEALENLSLDMCTGLKDQTLSALSQKSHNLRRISLNMSARSHLPLFGQGPIELSDAGLKELARSCPILEEFELCFSGWEFPCVSFFTQDGILSLVQSCPIRLLTLDSVACFNDAGMSALSSSQFLKVLELVKCQDVTDEGIREVVNNLCLVSLKISKCLGVSDAGLEPLIGSRKLDLLVVEDCVLVSENGVKGAARHVSYRQDLSWMY